MGTLKVKSGTDSNSWKGKRLSWAGRLVMIQVVVSTLPIYLLSILSLLASANAFLIKKMRNFFWQNTEEKHKIALIAWDKIIKPKIMGGVGIKDLKLQNKALGAKLV